MAITEKALGPEHPGVATSPENYSALLWETGRSVETVVVDGRVVMKDRKMLSVDEDALRAEVAELMHGFTADFEEVARTREDALIHMRDAHRRVWQHDDGLQRFLSRTR